jgi:7-cyano-7-deazaguanine synthase
VTKTKSIRSGPYDTVLLISGGLDSMVLSYILAKQHSVRLLYFDFERPTRLRELSIVKSVAEALRMPYERVQTKSLMDLAAGFVPYETLEADESDTEEGPIKWDNPNKPNRVSGFHILLGIGTYFAQLTGAKNLAVGLIKEQNDPHPKMKPSLEQYSKFISLFNPGVPTVNFVTPFLEMPKAEVIKLGIQHNVPLHESWSCACRSDCHCGTCGNCEERIKAFQSAGVKDPTSYANKKI